MDSIAVRRGERIRSYAGTNIGINVNFMTDGPYLAHQPTSLADAIRRLGVRYLRYPGGEKSDGVLWSTPPYDAPRPTLARTGEPEIRRDFRPYIEDDMRTFRPGVMDFDQFIALCRETGCEPYVVVCYDSMFIPPLPGGTIPTREALLETACAWVRYANIERGYGVKYWEIGNESYVIAHHNGAPVDAYAHDVALFAQGMKAVDPSIHILANGPTGLDANETTWGRMDADTQKPWWATVLPQCAPYIDGIAFHDYPCFAWAGYDYYATHDVALADPVVDHLRGLIEAYCAPEDAARLRMALTETHSADWSTGRPGITRPGWDVEATWGHAVVLFDMLASYLRRPEVDATLVWNTRWVSATPEALARTGGKYNFWDTLDVDNQPLPPGRLIELLNASLLDGMANVDSPPDLPAFAMVSDDGARANVFVINKGYAPREVRIDLGDADDPLARRWCFAGDGPQDNWARLSQEADVPLPGGVAALVLPPVSITLLSI